MSFETTPVYFDNELLLRVRNYTHVTSEAVTDEDIQFYFEQAENDIEASSGRKYVSTTKTETRDGDDTVIIVLENTPLISIESLVVGTTSKASTKYVFYSEGKLELVDGTLFTKTTTRQNVVINYTYGDVDNFQNVQNLAFYMVCLKVLQSSGTYEAQGATSEKFESYSVNYGGGQPYSGLAKDLQTQIAKLADIVGAKTIKYGIF